MPLIIINGVETAEARPSLRKMAASYAASTVKHVLAGCPKRSAAQVEAIIATHCRACEHFMAAEARCGKCRCPVKKKAVRALEKCPMNKW